MFNHYVFFNDSLVDTSCDFPHLGGFFIECRIFLIRFYLRRFVASRAEEHRCTIKIETIKPHLTDTQGGHTISKRTFMMFKELVSTPCIISHYQEFFYNDTQFFFVFCIFIKKIAQAESVLLHLESQNRCVPSLPRNPIIQLYQTSSLLISRAKIANNSDIPKFFRRYLSF